MNKESKVFFIGAFNGYIRGPQPSAKGVISRFYGEAGSDADTINAMGMTQYQNQKVHTSVYWIKDSIGVLKRTENGYPLITSYESFIRHPTPKSSGMYASLFAPQGDNSDKALELGFSKYADSFVHVQLNQGVDFVADPFFDLSIPLPFKKNTRVGEFKASAKVLQISDFFKNEKIWDILGGEASYNEWLKDRPCCAAVSPECTLIGKPVNVLGSFYKNYTNLPLCEHHYKEALSDINSIGGKQLLGHKRMILMMEWVVEEFCKQLGKPSLSDISPNDILDWTLLNQVDNLLPVKFKDYLLT